MRKVELFIWDEVMLSHIHQVDCVYQSLQDILQVDKPFDGLSVVFG